MVRLLCPATLVVLAVSGCSESPIRLPTAPEPQAPSVRTPGDALRFLEWSWNRRDIARYAEIVADDFRFTFSALDSYGDAYRDSPWTREDEIASIGHLFQVATSITFALDR